MGASKTYRRKIQLVAGVTYTVSLPKEWIKRQRLTDKQEIAINEQGDGSLIVAPQSVETETFEDFTITVDEYPEEISQILFVLYYLGTENITIKSRTKLPLSTKVRVKEAMRSMVGTEIIYEDEQSLKIKVLLDKSKVDINQLYYRISLIIKTSIDLILNEFNLDEVRRNEEEVDRLYHLIAKIIQLGQTHSDILHSSKIGNRHVLTSYLLIAKKLESFADRMEYLAEYLSKNEQKIQSCREMLEYMSNRLIEGITFFLNKEKKSFTKLERTEVKKLQATIDKIEDMTINRYLTDCLRFLSDTEEELTNISFFSKLMKQGKL